MKKTSYRLTSARLIIALLGLGGLSACNSCSQSEVNQARDLVAEVLDRFDRLDSICADEVQVTEVDGGGLLFTPVLRNDREPVSGGVRVLMTIFPTGAPDVSTPGPSVQLGPATRYERGLHTVADSRASIAFPNTQGVRYTVKTKVWAPLYPVPADEDPNAACHIRQSEYPRPG